MVSAKLRAQALPPKKKKKAPQAPVTADEFLAAGVDEEEGGEKWRAGDIVKSARFFSRALDHYTRGLAQHPTSADLAYNRARLQYDICQQPRLLEAFQSLPPPTTSSPSPTSHPQDPLQIALTYHEYALTLRKDDPDLTFNVGQLYRDIAEHASGDDGSPDSSLKYLRRALQAFSLCADLQNAALVRQSADGIPEVAAAAGSAEDGEGTEGEAESGSVQGEASEDEQWATVVDVVTPATLYETVSAGLQVVTGMVPLATELGRFDYIAELEATGQTLGSRLVELAAAAEVAGVEGWGEQHPAWEQTLLAANFQASLRDSACRQRRIDPKAYSDGLIELFGYSPAGQESCSQSPPAQWLADTAEADTTLNATLGEFATSTPPGAELSTLAALRWKHLTRALDSLTSLSKLGDAAASGISISISTVHARRAECELLRRRLGEPGNGALHASASAVLASNAEKFFRGARQLAERDGGEDVTDLHAREVITSRLAGGQGGAQRRLQSVDLERNVVEMVEESLVSETEAKKLAS